MMLILNRIEDSITGSANGKPFGVLYTEKKFKEMKKLADKANKAQTMEELNNILADFEPFMHDGYKQTVETACPFITVNEETGKFFLKTADGTEISSRPLPQELVDRILISVEKKIDFMPIVKAWTRFLRNPNYSDLKAARFARYINKTIVDHDLKKELIEDKGVTPEVAIKRATVYQTPITEEGMICTYKVSREIFHKYDQEGKQVPRYKKVIDEDSGDVVSDGVPTEIEDRLFEPAVQGKNYDPFHCYFVADSLNKGKEGHFIKVGRIHELKDWKQVDTRDDVSCVKGLHVGNRDYIRGYEGQGTVTHDTFVDPMDIGAITDDGSGALRVRRYYTYRSNAGINRSIYHSSTYGAMTDLEWDDLRKEAIKASEEKAKEAAKLAGETAAI